MKFQGIRAAALAAAFGLAAFAPVALAQGPAEGGTGDQVHGRGHRGFHRGRGHDGMAKLNLTDAQRSQLQTIHQNHRQATQPLAEELRQRRQALRQAQSGATFDEAAVRQQLTDIAALEAKLMGERFKMRQEFEAILTPEQKAQLEQAKQERIQKRMDRKAEKRQNP
jgi:periplasmic protein CpxP/Spy